MFIKFQTKSNQNVNIPLENIREITTLHNNYIRIFYQDGTEMNLSYNKRSFSFTTHHELSVNELNKLMHEINIMQ